jgi:hypothetical protein
MIDVSDLHLIAERLADAFDFTEEERQKFIDEALSNHEEDQDSAAEDDDAEG